MIRISSWYGTGVLKGSFSTHSYDNSFDRRLDETTGIVTSRELRYPEAA